MTQWHRNTVPLSHLITVAQKYCATFPPDASCYGTISLAYILKIQINIQGMKAVGEKIPC